ncbi:MAG: phage portal protein [Cyanobacteria bacterium P01_F01_bin.150]
MTSNNQRIETLDSGLLVVRNDGFLSNTIETSLLYNSHTGFGTSRDSSTNVRAGAPFLLHEQELRWLYRSSWLLRRVCDLPALDMTKKSIELVIKDGDEDDADKVMARWRSPLQDVSPFSRKSSYGFDQAKEDAERWARQFGAAYIVLRVNGDEDPQEPLTEINSLDGIAVLDCYSIRPSHQDFNRSDPEFYQLIYDRQNQLEANSGQLIHESRVLPYFGNKIHPYDQQVGDALADSIIQSMWTVFASHGEVKGSVQEALKSFSLLTVSINNLAQLISAGKLPEVKALVKEIGLQKSLFNILITDPEASGTGFEGRNLSGVRENFEIFREELTAASSLPYYKLWGTIGKAGLADSGAPEARAYAEMNTTAQKTKHLSNDERIIKILSSLELGRIPVSFEVRYPSIYEETEQERREGKKTTAETYQIYSTIPGVITAEEFRRAIATEQPLEAVIDLDENDSPEDIEDDERSDTDGFTPPQAVQRAAQRGLDLRSEHGRGGTEVGIARARDLSNGKSIPIQTIARMVSFFARHEGNKKGKDWNKPSNGKIAWLLWGGDPGKAWVNRIWKAHKREDYSYVRRIIKWRGLELGLEYLPGDKRFNRKMKAAYGHIRKHIGADGEALDCYVSADFLQDIQGGESPNYPIYRIAQLSRDDGDFDEYKYIFGVSSSIEAKNLYLHHMPQWAFGRVEIVAMADIAECRCDDALGDQLQNMATKHNEENPKPGQRASVTVLRQVYGRGEDAYRGGDFTKHSWAIGRVKAFLRLLATGKPKNKKYIQDNDLLPKSHKRSTRKDAEPLEIDGGGLSDDEWEAMANIGEQNVLAVLSEALEK